jgi:hypothetical protein
MEYKVQSRSPKMKQYVEQLMPGLIKQLKLERSRKFVLIEIARGITPGAYGSTTNLPGLDSYVIALNPQKWTDLGSTLAHEMVHVKQFAKGQFQLEDGKSMWMGKRITRRVKYLDQPWEVEAFQRQEILFRRAIESINV